MSTTSAIVFDMDDTLYPERQFAYSGYYAVARAFSDTLQRPLRELVARMRALFDTPDRGRVFDVIVSEAGISEGDASELVHQMIDLFRSHEPRISLHPDADAALTRFKGRARLGLISDGPEQMQRNKINALGLSGRLDEIVLTDQWGREFWKPHPRAFEVIVERLGIPADDCTYVADNPGKDFVAPNALGWRTVFVHRPDGIYRDRTPPAGGAPHTTIASLNELQLP